MFGAGKTIYEWVGAPDMWPWILQYAKAIPSTMTFFVIGVLIFIGHKHVGPYRKGALKRSHAAVNQFYHWWLIQWVVWLFFYGFIAGRMILQLKSGNVQDPKLDVGLNILEDILSNTQTTLFVICFVILSRETLAESAGDAFRATRFWMLPVIFLIAAIFFEIIAAFFLWSWPAFTVVTRSLIGLAAAVSMAMFVGRLESRFFSVPAKVIGSLYLYAALQVFYVFFEVPGASNLPEGLIQARDALLLVKPMVVSVALPLKVLLYLVVYWALTTGRLLFYFEEIMDIFRTIDGRWNKFKEGIT